MKIIHEDDLQICYEDENGIRITSVKKDKWNDWVHQCMCGCIKCLQPEHSKREDFNIN